MTELSAGANPAAVQLAAEDQPAADAGPDRHDDDLAGADGGAGAMLGERCQIRVVVDEHRDPEPLGHHVSERDVIELEVDRDDRFAGPAIDQGRDAEADRGDLPAGAVAQLVDGVLYGGEKRDLVETDNGPLYAMVNPQVTVEHPGQ